MSNLNQIFQDIKTILQNNSNGLDGRIKYIDSKAKGDKPSYHLYGTKYVSLFEEKPQPTFIAGVIQQKNYVSFYFSPIYSHPDDFSELSPELRKYQKGKSCFNLSKINDGLLDEIEEVLIKGINKYKEIKWI